MRNELKFDQLLRPTKITVETSAEILSFGLVFEDKTVHLNKTNHWLEVEVLGMNELRTQDISKLAAPKTNKQSQSIMMNKEVIILIQCVYMDWACWQVHTSCLCLTKIIHALLPTSPSCTDMVIQSLTPKNKQWRGLIKMTMDSISLQL